MRFALRSCVAAVTAVGVLTIAPHAARADERAVAEQLFTRGRQLMATGQTEQACREFQAAAQLSQTAGVRLNLAACWQKLGRTASAWAMYGEALDIGERNGNSAAADAARQSQAALAGQLCYLTVQVPAPSRVPGLVLTRDGKILPHAAWGVHVPVDPGRHTITARAPGRQGWSTTREVSAPGARDTVVVAPLRPRPTPNAPGKTRRTLAWVSAGVGLAGLAVGGVTGALTLSRKTAIKAHCTGLSCDAQGKTAADQARGLGLVSTIGFSVGLVGIASAVVLFATSPGTHASGQRGAPRLVITGDGQSASVAYRGTL
jgi:hypothetical protein